MIKSKSEFQKLQPEQVIYKPYGVLPFTRQISKVHLPDSNWSAAASTMQALCTNCKRNPMHPGLRSCGTCIATRRRHKWNQANPPVKYAQWRSNDGFVWVCIGLVVVTPIPPCFRPAVAGYCGACDSHLTVSCRCARLRT